MPTIELRLKTIGHTNFLITFHASLNILDLLIF